MVPDGLDRCAIPFHQSYDPPHRTLVPLFLLRPKFPNYGGQAGHISLKRQTQG